MPKQSSISSVLVIGAGPIIIGQACEFDYSGSQACKALKEKGLRVILVNSNPATIMTDPEIADATYIEPINWETIEKIIQKENPSALLSTVGGQVALNCSLELWKRGILDKYQVRMIGASPDAINKAENRQLFNEAMARIGLSVPRNSIASNLEGALKALDHVGLPAVIRPSFTLSGSGGGIAYNLKEFKEIVTYGLKVSPIHQVLIDESILGWKEYEMEVIRDQNDNAIIVCSIENLDPMGVHTGDSITVAPALTLTDKEYQVMRDASLNILREIGVETGGSNVQFAVNPQDGRLLVIEMNPRVSRSSALASKATGFPIAKVAALLAIGYTLDEIKNDVTQVTPASFEPTLDYVVTKLPRFNFEKFSNTPPLLSNGMRSVGEVMSIGRNFCESLQKGLRSLEMGLTGLNSPFIEEMQQVKDKNEKQKILKKALKPLSADRILKVAEALRHGLSVKEINKITSIDPWFLNEIEKIIEAEKKILQHGLPQKKGDLLRLKKLGFSDARLAELSHKTEEEVFHLRHKLEVRPVYKTVDTCSAEFTSRTSYLYSCYEGDILSLSQCEADPSEKKKVIILGSGPNRIGQGIEFDYTCVHAAQSLRKIGLETIMVNCNPETVSTDYDTSNKLYFEPLCQENVIELIYKEQQKGQLLGVIVQFGGQTPLKLSQCLKKFQIPILGTSPDSIDLAEDRERFQKLLKKLKLRQPKNDICYKIDDITSAIDRMSGFPVVIRPSHVLGGQKMAILKNQLDLKQYLQQNSHIIMDGPILIDRFLEQAIEIDVDAICDGKQVHIAGIMEHIEKAGIHSGDSACVLPPYSISEKMIEEIKQSTKLLAQSIGVVGFMNVQYAIKDECLYVIEVNPRSSRTVPFVSKATGVPIAKIATQVMVGSKLNQFSLSTYGPRHFAVKEVVLPFSRFPQEDVLLGPEMRSTGEVMGWSPHLHEAFLKAQSSAFNTLPSKGLALLVYDEKDHKYVNQIAYRLKI